MQYFYTGLVTFPQVKRPNTSFTAAYVSLFCILQPVGTSKYTASKC